MTIDHSHIAENEAESQRMNALVTRLTDADLARPLGDDWTVAIALAHMAFWDRRARLLLDHWERGDIPPKDDPEWYGGDGLNDALLLEWEVLPPREAARLAVEAADAVNRKIEGLAPAVVETIINRDELWLLRRFRHRREHLDEIERALVL